MSKKDIANLLELLYRSFDAELTDSEKQDLKRGLEEHPQLVQEEQILTKMRSDVQKNSQKQFAPGFSDRVMLRLGYEAAKEDNLFTSFVWSFRRLALIAGVTALLISFNNIVQANEVSLDSMLAMPTLSLENALTSNTLFEGGINAE